MLHSCSASSIRHRPADQRDSDLVCAAGVVLELEDCAYPLVKGIVATTSLETAFKGKRRVCLSIFGCVLY